MNHVNLLRNYSTIYHDDQVNKWKVSWVDPWLLGSVLLIFLVFCVVLLFVFTFWVQCNDIRYDFRKIKQWCSVRLYLQLFVGGRMSYLRYLHLFTYCGVQHVSCCALFCFSSSRVTCVSSFSRLFIFDCLSVFSNVYVQHATDAITI